jgi:hypothetical protein
MKQAGPDNERKHPRVRVNCPVRFQVFTKAKDYEDFRTARTRFSEFGTAEDLSLRGILFHTPATLHRGDFVQLNLQPPGAERPIEAIATVSWSRYQTRKERYSAGLRILNLKAVDNSLLARLISSLRAKADKDTLAGRKARKAQQELLYGEDIMHEGRVHWMVNKLALGWGFLALCVGLLTLETGGFLEGAFLLLLAAAMVLAGVEAWMLRKNSRFYVTNKRVIFRSGLLGKHEVDSYLKYVKDVKVKEPLAGRKLGYGTLVVTHTSGRRKVFKSVAEPHEVAKNFLEQLKQNFD